VYTILTVLLAASQCLVEVPSQVSLWGAGQESCGRWSETRHTPTHYQYIQWVEGFISGVNWACRMQQAQPLDTAAIVAFMDRYCTNNPLHPIVKAAEVLVHETGGPKITPPSPRR
jgi:hypothetical protein